MGYEVLGQTNKFIRTRKLQRSLRKDMTIAERKLWSALRLGQMNGRKFRRQHPFENYILDFVCLEEKLVIEVDGSQHFEQINKDEVRTKILEKAGFRVMRFWNNQVMNEFEGVTEAIFLALQTHPHPSLPLEGEGTFAKEF
jgi:very-short-patch-repair endonuclease